jgi:hypothetical protein
MVISLFYYTGFGGIFSWLGNVCSLMRVDVVVNSYLTD